MKLKNSISTNSLKIIELYNKVDSGVLDTSPEFQRKLVWKKQHKYAFINTILLNYPFPEIYIASAEMDVNRLKSVEIVVDGKQRITAIVDYIKGINDFATTKKVKAFSGLSNEEKREFLNYEVSVKDLKDLDIDLIKEIFQRINSTDYSLNSNERINARYGDGEFVMFCKQIVDLDFNPTDDETDIIIENSKKEFLNTFFDENKIFTENNKSRMFDVHFIMLVVSTLLEGTYFSRSTVIDNNLEKYNSSFNAADDILAKIIKSVAIIKELKLSPNSYWFNKANLFVLLVELSKIDESKLDIKYFESTLLDLEKKVDIYFTDEDISIVSEDERKYFEYSRQGSNGLAERKHRGKLINEIITKSLLESEPIKDELEIENLKILENLKIDFVVMTPTETGLKKSIMDAISSVRDFLKRNNFHEYENQEFGPDKKVMKDGVFIANDWVTKPTTISLYRANGRGDYRIWFTDLNSFASAHDRLVLINHKEQIGVLNITKIKYDLI